MHKSLRKKSLMILLLSLSITSLNGCNSSPVNANTSEKNEGIQNMEISENIEQIKNEVVDEENNYGFLDTSYENGESNGAIYLEPLIYMYGENDQSIIEKFNELNRLVHPEDDMDYVDEEAIWDLPVSVVVDAGKESKGYVFLEVNDQDKIDIYLIDENQNELKVMARKSMDVREWGVFNLAKYSVFKRGDYYLLSSQYPSRTTMDNYYIRHGNEKLELLKIDNVDPTAEYFTRYINLLEERKIDEAMHLEGNYIYPSSYMDLYCQSAKLSLEIAYDLSKESQHDDVDKAIFYLKWGLGEYFGLFNETNDMDDLIDFGLYFDDDYTFESEYLKEYEMEKESLIEILETYKGYLIENQDVEKAEKLEKLINQYRSNDEKGIYYQT